MIQASAAAVWVNTGVSAKPHPTPPPTNVYGEGWDIHAGSLHTIYQGCHFSYFYRISYFLLLERHPSTPCDLCKSAPPKKNEVQALWRIEIQILCWVQLGFPTFLHPLNHIPDLCLKGVGLLCALETQTCKFQSFHISPFGPMIWGFSRGVATEVCSEGVRICVFGDPISCPTYPNGLHIDSYIKMHVVK